MTKRRAEYQADRQARAPAAVVEAIERLRAAGYTALVDKAPDGVMDHLLVYEFGGDMIFNQFLDNATPFLVALGRVASGRFASGQVRG